MTHEQTERGLAALERIAANLEHTNEALTRLDDTLTRLEVAFLLQGVTPGCNQEHNERAFRDLATWFIPIVGEENGFAVLEEALRARFNVY